MSLSLGQADTDDAEAMASIVRDTSGGLVDYLLSGLSRLVTAQDLLTSLIMEPGNPFSCENALVLRQGDALAGLLLAYPAELHRPPDILRRVVSGRKLRHIAGLLEGACPDSLYINTLWLDASYRGTGLADDLLQCARMLASEQGLTSLSLNVWADNSRALRFYQRHGFTTVRHCDIAYQADLPHHGGNFLMQRDLSPLGAGNERSNG